MHLSQDTYHNQTKLNDKRAVILDKIQYDEAANVEYKELHSTLYAGTTLETTTEDAEIDDATAQHFLNSKAKAEVFRILGVCRSENFNAKAANKLINTILALMHHPLHPLHHFRNENSLVSAISIAATITATIRELEQTIIKTKDGTDANRDATERPQDNKHHWTWIRNYNMQNQDLEIVDVFNRVNESAYKPNLDEFHDVYVKALAENDKDTLASFTTDVQDIIIDALTALQNWGNLMI